MPDDFKVDRELFKEIESGTGLNEGDILKAIQRLNDEIKEEEDLQAGEDLSIATNQNVNPGIASRHARLAGLGITSGDQLKAATPTLKRMSKTFTDPNISAEVRAASLEQDMADVEQLILRSVKRDGQRGVEAFRGVRTSDDSVVSAPSDAGEFINTDKVAPRFFPEPDQPDPQDAEAFIRTLESETTLRSGESGQQDINAARQRNAIRISEFQANRAKQVTLGQGVDLFETQGGKATKIASGPTKTFKPAAASKGPTKAGIEGLVLQKVMQGATLTPGEQKIYAGTFKKGFSVTMPDGTVIQQGGSGKQPDSRSIAKPVISAIQKEMTTAQRQLEEIERIEKSGGVGAISGLWNRLTISVSDWASFLVGMPTSPDKSRLDKDFNSMMRIMKIKFRKSQTGVAFNPIEAKEYDEIFPNLARDGEDVVASKMNAIKRLSGRVIESGGKFLSARDFLDAFAVEIENVKTSGPGEEAGAPSTTAIDLSQFKR